MVRQTVFTHQNSGDGDDDLPEDDDDQLETSSVKSGHQKKSSTSFSPDDREGDAELRPQTLDQIIGQRKVIDRIQIMLSAAKNRNEPLGHLLLDGPPGIGKTTIATVIPKELGTECQITSGPALRAPKDLIPYLTRATEGSVLFIDEIHRLPPAVEEFIYPAMEDFRVDIALGEGLNARTINLKLKNFTVIGATTRSGMLTAPLRDRFVNRAHLDLYELNELQEIVTRSARILKIEIDSAAANEIATRSRKTPRKANNLLRWTRDYVQVKAKEINRITSDTSQQALAMLEIDELGLEEQDRKYLKTIYHIFSGGPAGLQAIAHSMNISPDTLEDEVEPFLLSLGFIQRTPRGRIITAHALNHLKLEVNARDRKLFE